VIRYNTAQGIKEGVPGPVVTYMGHQVRGKSGSVRLTVTEDLLYGYIKEGEATYNIEPLRYFVSDAPESRFVIYRDEDVKPLPEDACGVSEDAMEHIFEIKESEDFKKNGEALPMMECREVELAIAHDLSMFNKFGMSGTENHATTIMNLVQGNYDDEFFYSIEFIIVEQYVETSNPNFPTPSTNAGQVLSSFRNWGNGGGFTRNFDLGQLWTNRDFDGGTVGIAYLSAVCSGSRYHALQDYTANSNQLRCMVAHEIGHNFSCTHDPPGSNTIMAPSVSGSNIWSNQSINQVNNFTPNAGCLNICFNGQPPQAIFTSNPSEGCVPLTVQFQDQSIGPPDTWIWEFPGGTPSTSSEQNPRVTYFTPGTFDVTLTVINGFGQSTLTRPAAVVVKDLPSSAFVYQDNQRFITFQDQSSFANQYDWDFGDGFRARGPKGQTIPPGTNGGRTSGTYDNPVHRYDEDGSYVVILTVTGDCGADVFSDIVEVVSEVTAEFISNQQEGCAPFNVEFYDNSSENVQIWEWSFPGGEPETSNEANPVVLYDSVGVFDVTLRVRNSRYEDVKERKDYIVVDTFPTAYFGDSTVNLQVFFKDSSEVARGYKWYFGDGDSSDIAEPVHTYDLDTTYTVTQIVYNSCGYDTFELQVPVGLLPNAGFEAMNANGCPTLTVQFTDTSSSNTTRWFWTFPGGSPSSSTDKDPVVEYDTPGSYAVRLIAENGLGRDTLDMPDVVIVDQVPVPDFTFTRAGFEVSFTNISLYGNSYFWDFGDGNTSTEINPVHNYQMDGTYEVVLEVTNDCATAYKTVIITVSTAPSASFRSNITEECIPFTVVFENLTSNNATSYEWSFPGGNPSSSTMENPEVTYQSKGVYDVTLIASNANGSDTLTELMYILAKDIPDAQFNENVNDITVIFNNTTVDGDNYQWEFGDGNMSTEENPTHVYEKNGTYTVTLTATNECGTDVFTRTVEINAYPIADFSANELSGCAPLQVEFSDNSSNATSWSWSFPNADPSTSDQQNPVVTYMERGIYEVSLTVTNQYGNSSLTKTGYITVRDVPVASFDALVNGNTVQFNDKSVDGDSWSWDFGDGTTSDMISPEHEYSSTGTYNVSLIVSNTCGTDTLEQEVEIVDNTPVISISSSGTTGCVPFVVVYQDNSSNNPTSWNWTFEGGLPETSDEPNPTVMYNDPGIFEVTLEVTNQFGKSTAKFDNYITALDVPVADFTSSSQGRKLELSNQSQFGTIYNWDFGDGTASSDENPVHTYQMDGMYTVTLITTNQCGSDTTSQVITINSTGIESQLDIKSFELYPNPNSGEFFVNISGVKSKHVEFQVIDILGQVIYQQKAGVNNGVVQTELRPYIPAAGAYYLRVRSGDRLGVYKVIIQN
jgi:PKD repeat protein